MSVPFITDPGWQLVKASEWESRSGEVKLQDTVYRLPPPPELTSLLDLCKRHGLYLAIEVQDGAVVDFALPRVGIPSYREDKVRPGNMAITLSGVCRAFFAPVDSRAVAALQKPDPDRKYAALLISKFGRIVEQVAWIQEPACPENSQRVQDPNFSAIIPVEKTIAGQMFEFLKNSSDIPFDYPAEGCEYRAHESCRRLMQTFSSNGAAICKLYLEAQVDMLSAKTCNDRNECVWPHHVAPAVYAIDAGTRELMVLDPALCAAAATIQQWMGKVRPYENQGALLQTRTVPVEAFVPADNGNWTRDVTNKCTELHLDILRHLREARNRACGPPPYC